ncbi:hypothetical protein O9993_05200 [Vibrio lentus]|nr:hypothetical protein [Vibrio lentus]
MLPPITPERRGLIREKLLVFAVFGATNIVSSSDAAGRIDSLSFYPPKEHPFTVWLAVAGTATAEPWVPTKFK